MPRILALLALLAWLFILSPYPATIFMAGAIACLTLPLYRWLRARMSRFKAVLLFASGLFACLITPFIIVTILIGPQALSGIRRLNEWRASGWAISPELTQYIDSGKIWLSKIPGLSDWITEVGDNLSAIINTALKSAVSGGLGVAGSTMTAVWTVFLFVVLTSLAVVYAPTLFKVVQRITQLPEDSLKRFVVAERSALRAVFMGMLFVAIIQGTLCGIGFRIMGVSDPAFWGLLATFCSVIPLVGAALIWLPMAVILWFSGSTYGAIGLVVWCIFIVGGSDNIIRPYLLKTGIEASVFVLLLSILSSMVVLGPVGLVAGPALVAFALQAMKESDLLLAKETKD